MNINFRSIFVFIGYLITFVALLMVFPLIVEFFTNKKTSNTDLDIWLFIVIIMGFLGALIILSNRSNFTLKFSAKDSLIITFLAWGLFALLASLPFYFTSIRLSFVDSFFEATSGLTTTGASVIQNLNTPSTAIHVWRVMLGWVGSVGIIVTAVIFLPSTQGSKLFKNEAFETFDNTLDKAKQLALGVLLVYAVFTVVVFFALLYVGNLNILDAFIHAVSSISSTGFSNKNESAGAFNTGSVYIILSVSMFSSGIPYVFLYYLIFHRKLNLFTDSQVKGYFRIIFFATMLLLLWLFFTEGRPISENIIAVMFTVISLITGTGLTVVDYTGFGFLPSFIFIILMIIGGCAGSKAAGLKIYRIQMGLIFIKNTLTSLYLPKHIKVPLYNNKQISYEVANTVFAYIFLYFAVAFTVATIVAGTGVDFTTSFSAAIATLSNVGPGLGQVIGPAGSYYGLSDIAKLTLCAAMVLGRLEIFVILALFTKRFWQV